MTAMRILISVGRITMTVKEKQKSLLQKTDSRRCGMHETEEDIQGDLETGKEFEQNFAENEFEKRGSIPVKR
jgi:hypothetical protein